MTSPPNRPEDAPNAGQDAGRGGDMRSWVETYGPALRRYFEKRVSPAEAEDLVQDVFLSMQVRGQGQAIDNVKGYLFRVAANVLNRHHLHAGWRGPAAAGLEPVEEISPERLLIGKQAAARLLQALEALPPRAREALLLHRFEERTYAAVARRMGISVSAVEQLITRALKQVAAALEARP